MISMEGSMSKMIRRSSGSGSASSSREYDPLSDAHLAEYFGNRQDVKKALVELGLLTSNMKIVQNVDQQMRVVDRCLAELATEDGVASRNRYIASRVDAISRVGESREAEKNSKRSKVLAQYAKERKRRVEHHEKMSYSPRDRDAHE